MNVLLKIVAFITLISSLSAFAWREVGHFSVCEIAYKNLTPKAKTSVDAILRGKSFAEQCTWPDMVRKSKEWKHTYDWHFVNVEDNQEYLSSGVMNPDGDVMSAILSAKADLENPRISNTKKRSSLLFLGHFIGDIHQVVHIGRKTDLGGNKLIISWFGDEHFEDIEHLRAEGASICLGPYFIDRPTGECLSVDSRQSPINLHKLWDLLMVDKFIAESRIQSRAKYPYKEYVQRINRVSAKQVAIWQNSYVLDWAQESLCYRPWLYDVGDKNLADRYYRKHVKTLNTRMLMGGYRLAHTLNRIFDPAIRMKSQALENQEVGLLSSISAVKAGKKPSHSLSLNECALGVYRAP